MNAINYELAGQVAVVIGGASGIGQAIANEFTAAGCQTVVVDLAEQDADSPDHFAGWYQADIASFEQMEKVAASIEAEFGRCDQLVVASGAGSGKYGFPFWNLAPVDWGRVLDINLMGVVNAAHAFAPGMTERRSGAMLFLSSIAAQIGSQTDPPYSAAKAAVINFAQCAAKDLAEFDVRVNVICPGMVKTPLNESVWRAWNEQQPADQQRSYDDWAEEKIAKITPLKRWQTPADIAAMALFLASARAGNITGQTINVDGGIVMR